MMNEIVSRTYRAWRKGFIAGTSSCFVLYIPNPCFSERVSVPILSDRFLLFSILYVFRFYFGSFARDGYSKNIINFLLALYSFDGCNSLRIIFYSVKGKYTLPQYFTTPNPVTDNICTFEHHAHL